MAAVDYSKLRNHTLDSSQDEEAVTVNTRALIDKVLARYSGEWTTLRELIQNAADASATSVSIKFETLPSVSIQLPQTNDKSAHLKHTILNHTLRRLLVTNNGQAFGENDWTRLKRIAEGNPDETKIGAFGVGFYSVFADCESPFVTSGTQSMAFYWKGNSLFTRRGTLPAGATSGDTSFVLDYRATSNPVPDLMSICRFLSSSLSFIALENIDLWIDNWKVFSLRRKSAPSLDVPLPKDVETKTAEGMMHIGGVQSRNAQIDAVWTNIVGWTPVVDKANATSSANDTKAPGAPSVRAFFSRLTGSAVANAAAKRAAKEEEAAQQAIAEDITGTSHATVFIRVHTVSIKTNVGSKFAAELERATKKPPPKTTYVSILTSSYDETQASLSTREGAASSKVADVVLSALPTKSGQIFIGFPTSQTTGLLAHISAPSLIPTVERESIDLNARYVKQWNQELLSVAGVACRIAYSGEMLSLKNKLSSASRVSNAAISDADLAAVVPAANHIFKQFTFRETTPLAKAGSLIETAFWCCQKARTIDILSSCGVLPSRDVRIASEKLSFVNGLPVVPEQLMKDAKDFINKLAEYGLLSEIGIADIRKELERQALTEEQLGELLKWVAKKTKNEQLDEATIKSLFAATIVNYKASDTSNTPNLLLELRRVKTFVNASRIAPDLPTPTHTIPFRFSKSMTLLDLQSFGWEELQIVPWLRWVVESATSGTASQDHNILQSPNFSGQVLATVSRNWDNLSQSSKTTVAELLTPQPIIPTRLGMRKPSDSYFASVRLFDDLPVINNLNSVKEKFLKALGVRKTIELAVIFERLMRADTKSEAKPSWSHLDLVKYLVSVWNDIPDQDIEQLKATALCPAEVASNKSQATDQRYKVSELFEPNDALRALGLNILQWPGQYNAYGPEGKFLKILGLRTYPSAPELINIIAKAHAASDSARFEGGLKYFLENYYANSYAAFDLQGAPLAFLPLEGAENGVASKPAECFSNPEASVVGYNVLRKDLQPHANKLGVHEHPPMFDCARKLMREPPKDRAVAEVLFGYFASRLADVSPNIAERLGSAAIVPIQTRKTFSGDNEKEPQVRYAMPNACFLGDDEEYRDIFDYVDFGKEANLFLLKIGSKHEPSSTELARLLIREPARIYQTLGSEKYLGLLNKMHLNMPTLKKDKVLWKDMKRAPFLLAYKMRPRDDVNDKKISQQLDGEGGEYDSANDVKEWHLRTAERIVIVDHFFSYSLFKQHLVAAPQEEPLEDLYSALGAPSVSQLVNEEAQIGSRRTDQRSADHLRELVMERARMFLHEQPPTAIKCNIMWLERHLEIQTVQSVTVCRTLRGYNQTHSEKRSAAMTTSSTTRGNRVLSITANYEAWQVSETMVEELIHKPKIQTATVFEMFLTTSLYKLRARGYNVDRVLRRKEAQQARSAELDRQRLEEEESKKARQIEEARAIEAATPQGHRARDPDHNNTDDRGYMNSTLMPGSFQESLDRPNKPTPPKPKGLFSSLTRQFGMDDNNLAAQSLQNLLGNNNTNGNSPQDQKSSEQNPYDPSQPPPYSQYDPQALQKRGNYGAQPEAVSNPENTAQNLQRAIAASRPHQSSTLFSRPQTNTVKETTTYCDARHGQNLTLTSTTQSGLQFYIDRTQVNAAGSDAMTFVATHSGALDIFANLLLTCSKVFGLPAKTLHLFYDTSGSTIAFNSAGSIFANFRFFSQLHLPGFQSHNPGAMAQARSQALVYWWVVLCHELAHNLVGDHSSDHSYYTEHFVVQYFPIMVQRMLDDARADAAGVDGVD